MQQYIIYSDEIYKQRGICGVKITVIRKWTQQQEFKSCILHSANTHGKHMNPSLLFSFQL